VKTTTLVPLILALAALGPLAAEQRAESLTRLSLEPGMEGTLVTTISGTEPQEIPVTYLGTIQGYAGPKRDMLLIELQGSSAERVGVASGMSGSPVYFSGQLVGALAYRLGALPKSPVAGVTPIEDMLDAARVSAREGDLGTTVRPIATPVLVGGLAPFVREWAAPHLAELGFMAVSGDPAGTTPARSTALAPGRPVGVELVRGDLRIAASGTVTRVDGDLVYAFGHPLFGSGRVEMPMVSAEVIHTLADWAGSYHLVSLGPSIGTIVEDRASAIVGRLGHAAHMIPVGIRVRGGDYFDETFHVEVVGNSRLTPLLAAASAANSLAASQGYTDRMTVLLRGMVRLEGLPELPLEMAFSSSQGPDPVLATAGSLLGTLRELWDNPLGEVVVERLDLEVDVRPEAIGYRVESVHYDRGPQGGDSLLVRCVLREHRGPTVTRVIELPLPERLPEGAKLTLAVSNPAGIDEVLGRPVALRLETASSLETVIGAIAERRSAHRLTAVIYQSGGAVVSDGTVYSDLPPTAERLLSLAGQPIKRRPVRPLVSPLGRAEVLLDGPVDGGTQVQLKIERGVEGESRP
jgi:hypothetical protein